MIDPAPAATPSPSESSNGKKGPTCKVFRSGNAAISQESFGEISEILTQPDVLVWFDLVDPDANDLQVLKSEFDLHPLAIEDAVMAHERPKIEQYGDYWFLVLRPATQQENGNAVFHEMAVFAGEKFLITVRHQPEYPLKELEERWNAHPKQLRQGGGFLLYTILDTVVDGYFPVVSDLEDQIEQLEEELFQRESYSTAVLRTIFAFKRQGQRLRHAIMPMRDILNPIIRGDITLFPEDLLAYYRDVYDHSVRAID
ncbi:MAG: CorA family divalent cation transporter, partial [Chloroflexota bacterium]